MKKTVQGKIRAFLASEEGRVSAKAPLTLGVATGSVLLAQVIVGTPPAEAWWCNNNGDCELPPHICSVNTCIGGG